ncbi:MAG: hypothetical protein HFG00_12345 [Oscillibacter sp.]|nr:hypothetical protein [Oscillibacter sp.]
MRKLKKINGYLVVRFNDREKREYEGTGLGNFGVIDAELYTGILDVDRSVMEYESAETLEEAVEQARGLESELDVTEPEAKVIVVVESEAGDSEKLVEPEKLFKQQKTLLKVELQGGYTGLDPCAATHELCGYAQALEDLGMIDRGDERFCVPPDTFGSAEPPASAGVARTVQLVVEAPKAPENLYGLLRELRNYTSEEDSASSCREQFRHLPQNLRDSPATLEAYRLGALLEEKCPENDCTIYRNIFHSARELDAALDQLDGCPAEILQRELRSQVLELRRMYWKNYAVTEFRKGALS